MIASPDRYLDAFIDAGAAMLSVHVEALPHLQRAIAYIKSRGVQAGVALNPSTPAVALEEIAGDVDFVLVMSVNPGFGGQTFLPRSESKTGAARAGRSARRSPRKRRPTATRSSSGPCITRSRRASIRSSTTTSRPTWCR